MGLELALLKIMETLSSARRAARFTSAPGRKSQVTISGLTSSSGYAAINVAGTPCTDTTRQVFCFPFELNYSAGNLVGFGTLVAIFAGLLSLCLMSYIYIYNIFATISHMLQLSAYVVTMLHIFICMCSYSTYLGSRYHVSRPTTSNAPRSILTSTQPNCDCVQGYGSKPSHKHSNLEA